jgi:hypothetical protein
MSGPIMASPTSALKRIFVESNGDFGSHLSYSISQVLVLFGKILWLLLLLTLFAASFVVWLWVISFRSGWRFWNWVENRNNQQISTGLVYGISVLLISPFFLFVDWSQKQFSKVLPEWMKLPAHIPLHQLFEERLGITLGDEFPFFVEPVKDPKNNSKS